MSKKIDKRTKRWTRGSHPARGNVAGGGRFRKGHKKVGGRRKGMQNLLTREIKEAILNAAIRIGAKWEG